MMKLKMIDKLGSGLYGIAAFVGSFLYIGHINAQCEFTGLDSIYCITDPAVTMEPVDPDVGGTFSGPGVTGDTFDPAEAGLGTHTIYFETTGGGTGDKYYIKSNIGNPWGSTTNQTTMDNAFGPGGWIQENFETLDMATVFSPGTGFVFMDGSDGQATELATLLNPINIMLIEDWVAAGGRLLINSAPNEGGDINFGFDGTTLEYAGWGTLTNDVIAPDPGHPALVGPLTPTTPDMTGTYYSHAFIDGPGYTNVLVDEFDASNVILAEKCWGSGRVMMGGMTTYNWHNPDPHAENFRANLMTYLYENGCGGGDCIDSMIVTVVAAPDVVVEDMGEQCLPVELEDVLLTLDDGGADDNIIEWYTSPPDSLGDLTDLWPGGPISEGDEIYVVYGSPGSGCFDVELVEIVFDTPDAGADSTMTLCNSGAGGVFDVNTMLVGADPGGIWEDASDVPTAGFDPGTGLFDPTGVPAGEYIFEYITTEADPCPNDTAAMTFTIEEQPTAGEDNVGEICNEPGFELDLNLLLVDHDGGGYWEEVTATGGAFDPATGIFTMDGVLTAGDYTFEYIVLGGDPCINDTSEFVITVNPLPVVDAGADQEICDGDETSVSVSVIGGFGGVPVWDPASVTDGVPFTPAVGTETYIVTVTDDNGCVNTDALDITVHPLPDISFSASETEGCTDFETDFTIVSSEVVATTDWTFGDGGVASGITIPTVSHTYTSSGIYTVSATVTDINGCVNSETYTSYITVEDMPVADFDADPWAVFTNDTEVNFTNQSKHATDYEWNFGDGSPTTNLENPTHFFPYDQGDIHFPVVLKASNYLGCVDSIEISIHVREVILFYIPNTFTPDGDSYNDMFLPVFESGFDPYDFHMTVFNRWGEIVFESYNSTGGWDGTYGDGALVEDGVYVWSIDFKEAYTDKRHTHQGHVTVIK